MSFLDSRARRRKKGHDRHAEATEKYVEEKSDESDKMSEDLDLDILSPEGFAPESGELTVDLLQKPSVKSAIPKPSPMDVQDEPTQIEQSSSSRRPSRPTSRESSRRPISGNLMDHLKKVGESDAGAEIARRLASVEAEYLESQTRERSRSRERRHAEDDEETREAFLTERIAIVNEKIRTSKRNYKAKTWSTTRKAQRFKRSSTRRERKSGRNGWTLTLEYHLNVRC